MSNDQADQSGRDWTEYQHAVTAIANAPTEVTLRHALDADQRTARVQQAQASLNQMVAEHRTLQEQLDALARRAAETLTRRRVSSSGPVTPIAQQPVTSIADATTRARSLSDEITRVSEALDTLDQRRRERLHRALILAGYAAPPVLTPAAGLLLKSDWRLAVAAALLVIAAMVVIARKTRNRKTIWPSVIAGLVVGALAVGMASYTRPSGAVIGYALLIIILIVIATRWRRAKKPG